MDPHIYIHMLVCASCAQFIYLFFVTMNSFYTLRDFLCQTEIWGVMATEENSSCAMSGLLG